MKTLIAVITFILICFTSCKQESSSIPADSKSHSAEATEKGTDTEGIPKDKNDNRREWQKPELVLQRLGDIDGQVIADLGAGTGYFSFRLMRNAKKVIAIDIDPIMLQFINALKTSLDSETGDKIETRLATENDPNLKPNEVDQILCVNTSAYLPERIEYFKNLKKYIKPGGRLVILDFKMKRMDIDVPPFEERVLLHTLEEELYKAGYKNITTDDTSLEYQYFIFAEVNE